MELFDISETGRGTSEQVSLCLPPGTWTLELALPPPAPGFDPQEYLVVEPHFEALTLISDTELVYFEHTELSNKHMVNDGTECVSCRGTMKLTPSIAFDVSVTVRFTAPGLFP